MNVLITGVTGMAGSHLADYILEKTTGVQVHGLCRWRSPLDNVRGALERGLVIHHGDLLDQGSLLYALWASEPHVVFHLAAQSYVPYSFQAPAATYMTNVVGTCNLFQALDAYAGEAIGPTRVVVVSSSEVYGQVREDELPITEDQPFRPASPYGASKVGQDMAAYEWGLRGMDVVRLRPFTFTGPRRGDFFAASSFARQIALAEAGRGPAVVRHGNLESVRTWCDVRDMVEAFWVAGERCYSGEAYNVGGYATAKVGWALEYLCSLAHLAMQPVQDEVLMRPTDVTLQVPDIGKFRQLTGWWPTIPLERTLEDLLDYHREKVKHGT